MNSNIQPEINQMDIERLNVFLRGELAAVETYDQAISGLSEQRIQLPLREARASHIHRADLLRQRVLAMGGIPSSGSGIWGSFAKLVEGGAVMLGTSPAVAALEEGEDHGRDNYRADLEGLSPSTRTFVASVIVPEQLHTHDLLSGLKKELQADSTN
ncbi:MAG TPA: DUF2383 domain-containing protein [Polyangiaceae bacterium]|nr:DUF2383 domain-containing protein [Polyangiaceae bacterium]